MTQYATDANLRARQRLWEQQQPRFDIVGWVLGLAGLDEPRGQCVLDVGCGNGLYLRALAARGITAVGCDLSPGMLAAAGHPYLANADAQALPFGDDAFDVVLAPHMLYHVPDRAQAAREMRRVLRPGGVCVIVTNGDGHTRALRTLVEAAVREATPGWVMRTPATHVFSIENGEAQFGTAFERVVCTRPPEPAVVRLTDACVAADYVASIADSYAHETSRPWSDVVASVRTQAQQAIDTTGSFDVANDVGAFVCR